VSDGRHAPPNVQDAHTLRTEAGGSLVSLVEGPWQRRASFGGLSQDVVGQDQLPHLLLESLELLFRQRLFVPGAGAKRILRAQ